MIFLLVLSFDKWPHAYLNDEEEHLKITMWFSFVHVFL